MKYKDSLRVDSFWVNKINENKYYHLKNVSLEEMIFSRPKKRKDLRIFSIFPTLGKKYTKNTKQREKKIRSELEQRNGKI